MAEDKNTTPSNATGDDELFDRFPRAFVVHHILLICTFTVLLLTGLPLLAPKFVLFKWIFYSEWVFNARSIIHRIAAAAFIAQGLYHVAFMLFNRRGRKDFHQMLPKPKDAFDAIGLVLWNLGLKKQHPKFGRFSFIEKFEYLALLWGSFIMIVTGIILWFNQFFLGFFPKIIFDLSTIIHGFEAMLAGLAIIIWHMYTVHLHPDFFPMNRTWLDGKISKKNLKTHHYLEYVEIMKERGEPVEEEPVEEPPPAAVSEENADE
jgi:cytochrome b subunit of formate dehydrogenase